MALVLAAERELKARVARVVQIGHEKIGMTAQKVQRLGPLGHELDDETCLARDHGDPDAAQLLG